MSGYESVINIISCLFTILALLFTLYLWLLDHLSEDENKFVGEKRDYLVFFNKCLDKLDDVSGRNDLKMFLEMLFELNGRLEIIIKYRFWTHSGRVEEYKKINQFQFDTRYLISTIRRSLDTIEMMNTKEQDNSLVNIPELKGEEIRNMSEEYRKGLCYIIEFLENWA